MHHGTWYALVSFSSRIIPPAVPSPNIALAYSGLGHNHLLAALVCRTRPLFQLHTILEPGAAQDL